VADVTGSPEMLGGRVKTLHPKIHGGILADRDEPSHLADLEAQGIEAIDLVVSNLYPFSSDPSIELIDIGGPSMVRGAAKNHAHVGIVTSPRDYPLVLDELRRTGSLSDATRRRLARAAFAHTAAYDAAIVAWLDAGGPAPVEGGDAAEEALGGVLAPTIHLTLERTGLLRYGENPHQRGARYRTAGAVSWWDEVQQHGGKELSYLNLFDGDAAWRLVHELAGDAKRPAVAIIKHANPCGAAVADSLVTAYERALECDVQSAFGGVVAIGGVVTEGLADAIAAGPQADVIIASSYEPAALEKLTARRKATRLLSGPAPEKAVRQLRSLGSSVLVQDIDQFVVPRADWTVVTARPPTKDEWSDLVLAWRVCGRTTSNAIAIVNNGQAVGVGAGQQSRVVAAEIAVRKAGEAAKGGAGASDAFFPFPDGLLVLAAAGVTAVVQPGGSVKDAEVIASADEAGLAMVVTGERHFRH
jgi:phosphoribosylaminoimidazolecarboxamide formyltransferase/IMP cyclohydrolase